MERILICGMGCAFGGVEEYLMNIFRNIDRKKYMFDFIINDSKKVYCEQEIKKMGGNVFYLNDKNIYTKNKTMKKLMKVLRNSHDIIYFNTSSFYNISAYKYAKKLKYRKIIVHAHNTKDTSRSEVLQILHYFNRIYVNKIATKKLACSKNAAEWIFGKKEVSNVKIINNAIDTEKFEFNQKNREEIRKRLNIENKFVIGHIGRFIYQKNHDFLIDIFNKVVSEKSNSVLLMIGEGELKQQIEEKVKKYKIEDKVIFYGTTDKVYELYNAMDCFVFPSIYEGFGIVLLEAQANGLPCYASDTISENVKITNLIKCISLSKGPNEWANSIKKDVRNHANTNMNKFKEFDIRNNILKIEDIFNEEI